MKDDYYCYFTFEDGTSLNHMGGIQDIMKAIKRMIKNNKTIKITVMNNTIGRKRKRRGKKVNLIAK